MMYGESPFASAPLASGPGFVPTLNLNPDPPSGRVLEIEFDSPLWWQRKPKKISEPEAVEALKEAAKVIRKTAQEQVAEAIPEAQRKGQARKAIEPVVLTMPGFDWRPMYEQAYSEALTAALLSQLTHNDAKRRALAARRRMDDEIVLLMLL